MSSSRKRNNKGSGFESNIFFRNKGIDDRNYDFACGSKYHDEILHIFNKHAYF